MKISQLLVRLQDTTAQIRVRGAMLLLVALVVVAEKTGLETILGAFVAGAVVSMIDRDTPTPIRCSVPSSTPSATASSCRCSSSQVASVSTSTRCATTCRRSCWCPSSCSRCSSSRCPRFVYRNELGSPRATVAAGLLQATSLPFIVTASMIGVDIGALTPATGSAFVAAGLLSAVLFPALSLTLLRPTMTSPMSAPVDAEEPLGVM